MKLRNVLTVGVAGLGIWQLLRQRERANAVSLKNKVVIITGASSGIGRSAAKIFSAQGAHTVLVARRANLLAEVQSELQASFDTRVLTVAADVTNEDDIQNIVQATLDEFGRIDVLVNNAGIVKGGYLEEKDFANWQSIIEVNLTAVVRLTQAVLPIMKEQYSGHIVNVSSVVSFAATPGQAVYVATKSGMNGFSESLRREVADFNINVSVVMPGFTDTPMNEGRVEKIKEVAGEAGEAIANFESADYVASNVVAAVRYQKSQVTLGGVPMQIMQTLHSISPSILDFVYTQLATPKDLVAIAELEDAK
ncbi:MAG: SDR family NAD(P)-dependent oxidoreductase [Chloroflexota bacterium]